MIRVVALSPVLDAWFPSVLRRLLGSKIIIRGLIQGLLELFDFFVGAGNCTVELHELPLLHDLATLALLASHGGRCTAFHLAKIFLGGRIVVDEATRHARTLHYR